MNIGFMGGTFSPPHLGHLYSAKSFLKDTHLDLLYVIPAKVSPFKTEMKETASDKDRLEMTRLCFGALCNEGYNVTVSEMEISKASTSYTYETVRELKRLHPDATLYMYVGSDMYISLERWKNASELFESCIIYTKARNEKEDTLLRETSEIFAEKYGAHTIISNDEEFIVSSTGLREIFASGNTEKARNLLTDDVLRYIIKNGLYL